MFKQVHKKQKSVRELYAFWLAAGITGVIAIVWLISLQYQFDTEALSADGADQNVSVGAFSQFVREAKTSFFSFFNATSSIETEENSDNETGQKVPIQDDTSVNSSDNARTGFFLEPRTAGYSEIETFSKETQGIRIKTTSQSEISSTTDTQ